MTELAEVGGDPDGTLLKRLFRAFAVQLDGFEAKMADQTGGDGVKELTALAKALEALHALYARTSVSSDGAGMNVAEARAELMDRVRRLGRPTALAGES